MHRFRGAMLIAFFALIDSMTPRPTATRRGSLCGKVRLPATAFAGDVGRRSTPVIRTLCVIATEAVLLLPVSALSQSAVDRAKELPEGNGRDIAAAKCVGCHDASRLVTPGYSHEGWQNVVSRMMKIGVTLTPDQLPVLTDYLARTFPQKPQPAAQLLPGSVEVSFREWAVATAGAFPHDPLATTDGAIWYTGQRASLLGRIDPASGSIREYPTSIPDSGPHGLTEDAAGNIWFTANSAAYVGKLDPKSGAITAYRMPDPKARDPHTPIFDHQGVLWFTVQGANMIGRLVPRTGEVKLVVVPTAHALPYGMVVSSKGVPFFAEFGTNRIGDIDPHSLVIHEHVLPNAGSRPRRLGIGADDIIWYTDYARGYLGRFDPTTGAAKEWASPGGPQSQPYGITVLNGTIWYSESGVRPNTLVRFDPRSAKFQTWAIPSGGGVVRNMMPTHDGQLVLAESGVGKLALVTIK
jgi:virginiamycin B lyase